MGRARVFSSVLCLTDSAVGSLGSLPLSFSLHFLCIAAAAAGPSNVDASASFDAPPLISCSYQKWPDCASPVSGRCLTTFIHLGGGKSKKLAEILLLRLESSSRPKRLSRIDCASRHGWDETRSRGGGRGRTRRPGEPGQPVSFLPSFSCGFRRDRPGLDAAAEGGTRSLTHSFTNPSLCGGRAPSTADSHVGSGWRLLSLSLSLSPYVQQLCLCVRMRRTLTLTQSHSFALGSLEGFVK